MKPWSVEECAAYAAQLRDKTRASTAEHAAEAIEYLLTQLKPLTEREVELMEGMIEAQLDHARRCDSIANRPMAEKQKAWDMERVELLRKLKAAHGIKENT